MHALHSVIAALMPCTVQFVNQDSIRIVLIGADHAVYLARLVLLILFVCLQLMNNNNLCQQLKMVCL